MFSLLVILQVVSTISTLAQFANYILLLVNGIYTIIMTVFIVPTWKEHKNLVQDYNNRTSINYINASKELKDKEKEEFQEIIKAIKDIKHDINQLRQDKSNTNDLYKSVEAMQTDIHNILVNQNSKNS
jgi:signal transduction histidine kinase